jgi:hypothetical protein
MNPQGRPKGEYRRAQSQGRPVNPAQPAKSAIPPTLGAEDGPVNAGRPLARLRTAIHNTLAAP